MGEPTEAVDLSLSDLMDVGPTVMKPAWDLSRPSAFVRSHGCWINSYEACMGPA